MAQAPWVAGMVLGEKGKVREAPTTGSERPAGKSITSQPLVLQQTPAHQCLSAARRRRLGIVPPRKLLPARLRGAWRVVALLPGSSCLKSEVRPI